MSDTVGERIDGNLKRAAIEFVSARNFLDALEGMVDDGSPTASTRQALTSAVARLSDLAAVIDELRFITGREAENDALG